MSRPSFRATEEQRHLVKSLSALGMPQDQIGQMLGLRSPKTLRKHFRRELSSGMAEANAVVARVAYQMAESGRYPAMTFFWLKCQRPQNEKLQWEPEQKPTGPGRVVVRVPGRGEVGGNGSEECDVAA